MIIIQEQLCINEKIDDDLFCKRNAGNDISEVFYNIPIRHAEGDAHNVFCVYVCDGNITVLFLYSAKYFRFSKC